MSTLTEEKLCNVSQCRYPFTHATHGHRCGSCKNLGHGVIECLFKEKIDALDNKCVPFYLECSRYGCTSKTSHTTIGHQCHLCDGFHSLHNCSKNQDLSKRILHEQQIMENQLSGNVTVENDMFVAYDEGGDMQPNLLNEFAGVKGKIFTYKHAGMGCYNIYRRDDTGHIFDVKFIHSDDGYEPKAPVAERNFIEGYTKC